MQRRAAIVARLLACALASLGGCVAHRDTSERSPGADLPLVLNHNERITELLDGVVNGSEIIAVGEDGTILRSGAYGESWEPVPSPVHALLTAITFAPDARHGWIAGAGATLLHTNDAGATWVPQASNVDPGLKFHDVIALDAAHAIAVGDAGLYVETKDAGETWIRRRLVDGDSQLNRITRGPAGTLYLAGEHGVLLRSRDDGASWTRLATPEPRTFYGVLPLGPKAVLAYGGSMKGNIYRSVDDGATWTALRIDTHVLCRSAVIRRNGSIWLDDQYRSVDGGRTFQIARKIDPAEGEGVMTVIEAPNGSLISFGTSGATVLRNL